MDWEAMELQRLQNLYDPEFAPCAMCMKCGMEVYDFEAYEEHDCLCKDCWEEENENPPAGEENRQGAGSEAKGQ